MPVTILSHPGDASSSQHTAPMPVSGVEALVGRTPMLDLSFLVERPGVRLLAKAEFANPGGSVKDRPALSMILDAETKGLLLAPQRGKAGAQRAPRAEAKTPPRRILDATSGNTGIALAMLGAARGHRVTLCLPANASEERKRLLAAYGAEVVLTDPLAGTDGAIEEARRKVEAEPQRWVYLDQYSNEANWQAHYRTTGPEIWTQARSTEGPELAVFVTALGTTGTFMGVGRYLATCSPRPRLISVQPDGPLHGLEGVKHMESALVPGIYDPDLADEDWALSTDDAYDMVRRLARHHGLRLGVSAGANVVAAVRAAEQLTSGTVVTILCDGADKYLSEAFWDLT
ncbi:MAG: cysteine synthase family protein [Acidobacteriota bacterium]